MSRWVFVALAAAMAGLGAYGHHPRPRWLTHPGGGSCRAHGVSYLAWAWNVGSCAGEPSLITGYGGTPTRTYGQGYRQHLTAP